MSLSIKPPIKISSKRKTGEYCIRAKSLIYRQNGKSHIEISGYDTDMSIINRVDKVTKTKSANLEMIHTEVEVLFLSNNIFIADGTIFLKYTESDQTIKIPPHSF